jgi:hypothetical protein
MRREARDMWQQDVQAGLIKSSRDKEIKPACGRYKAF